MEKFYDLVMQSKLLAPFFESTDMARQRRMQKSFLNHVLGGKPYNGRSMGAAHARLGLRDEHFDEVLGLLKKAMTMLAVPSDLIVQVLAIAETTRNDVLGRS